MELDGGTCVYAENERPLTAGEPVAIMTVRLPAARAHTLAHLMRDWLSAFRITPDRYDKPGAYLLGRSIEDAAAAVGDAGAMACATRAAGPVPSRRRLTAVDVLRAAEPTMSPVERIAFVDAAAGWLDEDGEGDLALALRRAGDCSVAARGSG